MGSVILASGDYQMIAFAWTSIGLLRDVKREGFMRCLVFGEASRSASPVPAPAADRVDGAAQFMPSSLGQG